MTASDFSAFYQAVHEYPPFRWQIELLKRIVDKGWPDTIKLPTSSGKTSIIDIAVFLLALEAGKSLRDRRAAIRTFFVVDRRVVVDEAHTHALRIAERLNSSEHPVTKAVAEELRRYDGAFPLQVSRMRGGIVRDSGWADEPNQPLICVSTVDQVGSRLLFRGYQVNDRTRPVHAALVGIDTLIVLDEAHLSNTFSETLQTLARHYTIPDEKFPQLVTMSATAKDGEDVFSMEPAWVEADADTLKPRLTASKPAELREPKKRFEDEMVTAARELAAFVKTGPVGVIANTIASAREIFDKLSGEKVLLVGRNRPWSSEKLWERYKPQIDAGRDGPSESLLYVVATQTVEVGANISFDALVTECAPIDALRQRFGRLNRLGRVSESRAIIVFRSKGDIVYGNPTEDTWKFLKDHAPLDFGVLAMDEALYAKDLESMRSRSSGAPVIFPGHMELWSQTNPPPEPGPDVAPFLHGPDALETADVQIVWRENLRGDNTSEWEDLIDLAPPLSREALPMPIASVRRWLRGATAHAADIEGTPEPADEDNKRGEPRPVIIWTSKGAEAASDYQIRPGQTIVIPVSYCGADEYGWNPDGVPRDIFDEVNADEFDKGLRKRIVRLDLLAKGRDDLETLLRIWRTDPDADVKAQILEALDRELRDAKIDPSGRIATLPKQRQKQKIEPLTEEYDDTDDHSFASKRTLDTHTKGVEKHAHKYATGCGLSEELIEDIALAARLHDWGKCDERFQAWLIGKPFAGKEYLAKSSGDRTPAENRRLRKSAEYPENARHEAASVTAACASGLLAKAHDCDLVLHLIGTHHGWGRPWFPVWERQADFRVRVRAEGMSFECSDGGELAHLDSGWMDRFTALNRRYGYWGLAYLESILRRADCMQSRKEAESASD